MDKNKKTASLAKRAKAAKETEAILAKLPGDLRRMAVLIGLEHTMLIVDEWGGAYVNIPKCDDIKREIRVAEAKALYDAPGGHVTIRELAHRFGVTDRTIKTWLSIDAEDEMPLPLLELMKDKA
jgi:hypothetical protein